MHGVEFDLLLAAYIVNPSISSDDVAAIAKEFGYYNVLTNDSVYGKGAKKSTPEMEKIAEHASRKAQAIWNLKPTLEEKLKENEQYSLYKELELPLASILRNNGIGWCKSR